MSPRNLRPKILKQSSLSFASKRSSIVAGEKEKSSKPAATTSTTKPLVHDDDDIKEASEGTAANDIEDISSLSEEDEVEQVSEYEPSEPSTSQRGNAVATKKGKGKKVAKEEVEEGEDQEERPKKKRRTGTKAVVSAVELKDGAASKRRRAKGNKNRSNTVFGPRDSLENSESVNEADWGLEEKIKITLEGSNNIAKHVDRDEVLRHFGYVREKMGNVKPGECDFAHLEPVLICARSCC